MIHSPDSQPISQALTFLRLALSSHAPPVFQPHVAEVLPIVLGLTQARYGRDIAEISPRYSRDIAEI